jgi:hypothetical protein
MLIIFKTYFFAMKPQIFKQNLALAITFFVYELKEE